jgi:hypothetical protein
MKLVETVHAIDEWADQGLTRFKLGLMDDLERAQWLNEGTELFLGQATSVCKLMNQDGLNYSELDSLIQQTINTADTIETFDKLLTSITTMFRVIDDNYTDPVVYWERDLSSSTRTRRTRCGCYGPIIGGTNPRVRIV